MSAYTDFVRQHFKSAKGSSAPEKMRSIAAMWRGRKGRGLHAPGATGRGVKQQIGGPGNYATSQVENAQLLARLRRGAGAMKRGRGSPWSDYDMKPRTEGEGVRRRRGKGWQDALASFALGSVSPAAQQAYPYVKKLFGGRAKRGGRVNTLPNCGIEGGALSGMLSMKQKRAIARMR